MERRRVGTRTEAKSERERRRRRGKKKRKGDQIGRIGRGLINIVALAVGGVDGASAASRGRGGKRN